ncbi:MAG TPA: PAS domain-containing protein, partial [Myxococcota bacterium]|nr:PAS domain-containing protein [Myxococcota bacterium]
MDECVKAAGELSALRELLDRLPCVVYRASCSAGSRRLEFVSEACLRVTGRPARDFTGPCGLRFEDLAAPEDRAALTREIDSALSDGRSYRVEYPVTTQDGRERWLCDEGRALLGPGRTVVACEGVVFDVTRTHQASEEARRT